MTWSKTAWTKSQSIYDRILGMPFIHDLKEGTLAKEKFRFYIAQDSLYLENFGRTLSLIAARAHEKSHVLDFVRFAEGAIVVESALHKNYLEELGNVERPEISPSCHHYNSFLLSMAALSQVEIAMAAVLPCFWVYQQVGNHIFHHQTKNANPYQHWINTYAGDEFEKLVKKAIQICDEAAVTCTADQQNKMTNAFITGCRLEWQFWDSAWRLEEWGC